MTLLTALTAISAIAMQGGTMTLAGKVVQVTYPSPPVRQVPDEVKSWDGFQGLGSGLREWPTPFMDQGDWSSIASKLSSLGLPSKDGPVWRTKVFILTHTDSLVGTDTASPAHQVRHRLDQKQVDSVLRALARVPGYVRAATDGTVNLSLDVTVDDDPVVFGFNSATDWLKDYVGSKVNRGRFDAEDKLYRGPYQSVLILGAGPAAARLGPSDQGVALYIPVAQHLGPDGSGVDSAVIDAIAVQAYDQWLSQGVYRAPGEGVQAMPRPTFAALFPTDVWSVLMESSDPSYEQVAGLYKQADKVNRGREDALLVPSRLSPISWNVELTVANDDQRGSVLRYAENSLVREGGFALPYQSVDTSATPFLSFWAKTSSRDGLALHTDAAPTKNTFERTQSLLIPADGAWHQVVVDLRSNAGQQVLQIYLGPKGVAERETVGSIVYFFDDFQLLAQGQATLVGEPNTLELVQRANAARSLSAADLAKEPSDYVKYVGIATRQTPYATSDEAALVELAKSPNVRIAGEAVKRLAQLGTPTAKAEVLRLVTSSPYEYVKQVAAGEVGKIGDPKTAGILSRLFASKSWQSRLAGAHAMTMLPGDDAAVIAMTFLQETDPQVRLAVTRGANTKNAVVLKRLLWSTVNDPSDAVRAESAWRLITSGRAKEAAEGYKAIRDDSVGVRLDLLGRMAQEPAEGHRGAIQIAVTDLSPRVRAAALTALAKQPGAVTVDEVSNTLEDKFPIVQMALIDLAKAKSIALPSSAVQSLRASIDPRVVERARDLGQ